jgi:predicted PurR-regulated permease PerM
LGTLLGIGRGVGAALTILGYVVLTPVLMVYLLRDFDRITSRVAGLIPLQKRERFTSLAREYDNLLSRFLRGQLVAAAIVGVLTWLGLMIAGFPNSGLVGVVAGVFNIIPYLGLVVSIIPVVIISLVSGSVLGSLLKAGIVFAIVQFIDGSVTGPRIVGDSVGLHPVWVILAIAVGSFFYGFVGLLLAMPGAVLIKLLIRESLARYRQSRVFQGTPEPGEIS